MLLITDSERRPYHFAAYTAELLSLEGLTVTGTIDPQEIPTDGSFAPPDRIVVASVPLGAAQATVLREAVAAGRLLVAFLPSPDLAEALGFTVAFRTTLGGLVRYTAPGLPKESLQFHGPLRHDALPDGAELVAVTEQGEPAVVRIGIGAGSALVYLFDLPQSVALTRQGDPRRVALFANEVTPGWRAADLFVGHLDFDRAHLPQADLHCHVLRHELCAGPSPLPWLWYFPDNADSVLLLSSDDDWSTPEQFAALLAAAERYDATITFYLVEETVVTPEQRTAWAAAGHTFSIHPNLARPPEWSWKPTVARHRTRFTERFGVAPGPSVRNHVIPWVGWATGGRWMHEAGFTWDSNHFSCPPHTKLYMTGAGLPARLTELDGTLLPIYEQPAHASDETTLGAGGLPFSLNLTTPEAIALLTAVLQRNAATWHSLLAINTHPVSFATYSAPLWEALLAAAQAAQIPRIALDHFAAFWEARAQVRLVPLPAPHWKLHLPASPWSLTLMLPDEIAHATLDGAALPLGERLVQGRRYRTLTLGPERTVAQRNLVLERNRTV